MKLEQIFDIGPSGLPPAQVLENINEFYVKNIGKKITLKLSNEHIRSLAQNNYFHRINGLIAAYLRATAKAEGNEQYYKINEETTKIWVKETFLGYTEVNGEKHLRKTSTLKTFEMNELWENLQIYFAQRGLDIPSPNE